MDFNKISAGLLAAGVVFVAAIIGGETVFAPDKLEKQAYVIDTGVSADSTAAQDTGPKYMVGEEFAALVASANIAKGEKLIKKCTACHAFNQGGANKVGPALWGIIDQDIASVAGFKYSGALSSVEGNWTVENMNAWLYKPKAFAKGNKMSFAGLKKDQDRANLIAYLKTLK